MSLADLVNWQARFGLFRAVYQVGTFIELCFWLKPASAGFRKCSKNRKDLDAAFAIR